MEKPHQNIERDNSESLNSNEKKQKVIKPIEDTTSSGSSAFAQVMSQMNIADLSAFDTHYKALWQQASEDNEMLSVLICEIDDFKAYNAHYGHQAAAFMLLVVALELKKKCVEFEFFLARYKADKFVILIKGSDLKRVEEIAESLRQNVHKSKTKHEFSKVSNFVTLSIGISYIYPTSMSLLMKKADSALSSAQASGNTFVSLPPILDGIKERKDPTIDPVIIAPSSLEALSIRKNITLSQKSTEHINLEGAENKKEKRNQEEEMISQLQGVKPSFSNTTPLQDKKSKPDMLSRLKSMIPSPSADNLADEVDMISQLKGIAPSPDTSVSLEKNQLSEKGALSLHKSETLSEQESKDKEQLNFETLKAELDALKRKSESDEPIPPVRYY